MKHRLVHLAAEVRPQSADKNFVCAWRRAARLCALGNYRAQKALKGKFLGRIVAAYSQSETEAPRDRTSYN
jgi:hypothetical protein